MLGLLSDTERALVGKVGSCEEKQVKSVSLTGGLECWPGSANLLPSLSTVQLGNLRRVLQGL